MKKIFFNFSFIFCFFIFAFLFVSCSGINDSGVIHEHSYFSSWSFDDEYHYHLANCEHDDIIDKEKHTFVAKEDTANGNNKVYKCSICGYEKMINTYTIIWKNYDGEILEIDNDVLEGTMPSYDGKIPTRSPQDHVEYIFVDWYPSVKEVDQDIIYEAIFEEEIKCYDISFDLNGGQSNSEILDMLVYDFDINYFHFDLTKDGYAFRGWSYNGVKIIDENKNIINNVTMESQMIFKAEFSSTVTITTTTNMQEAGEFSTSNEYNVDSTITLSAKPMDGYSFEGWYLEDCYLENELLSMEKDFLYKVPNKDVTLLAYFTVNKYSLEVITYNGDYGYVTCNQVPYGNNYNLGIEYQSDIILEAHTTKSYEFLGWFDKNNKLVCKDEKYSFKMPSEKYKLVAKWNYFTIRYYLNYPDAKNNSLNDYNFKANTGDITLYEPTRYGYTFEGWYYNDVKYTHIDTSDEQNWISFTFEARFRENETVNYIVNHYRQKLDKTYASTPDDTDYLSGKVDTYASIVLKDYIGFTEPLFDNVLIKKDGSTIINLMYPRKVFGVNTTSNNINAGFVSMSNGYLYEEKVKIFAAANPGYRFIGWFENGEKISDEEIFSFVMPAKNLYYEARFVQNTYVVTMDSMFLEYNGNKQYRVTYDEPFTFPIATFKKDDSKPIVYNVCFKGWKCNDTLITDSDGYIENWNIPNNVTLKPEIEFSNVYFGSYPQTLVDPSKEHYLLSTEFDANSWTNYGYYEDGKVASYMYYKDIDVDGDGQFDFRGVYFNKIRPSWVTSKSDESIKEINGYMTNTTYWFKYEPIKWKVIESKNRQLFIMSELVIDAQDFYPAYESNIRQGAIDYLGNNTTNLVYVSNYMFSHIRSWLNTTFYNTAFNDLQKKLISIEKVDNSASNSKYACDDTNDKIFLLSHKEISNYYSDDIYPIQDRASYGTDYAKCQGIYVHKNGTSSYLLRSFRNDRPTYVEAITSDGEFIFIESRIICGVRVVCKVNI